MDIEYQLSKEDYIKSHKLYLKDVLRKKLGYLLLFTLLFIVALSGNTIIWWRFLLAIIISPVLVLIISYYIPVLISSVRLKKVLSKDKSGLEKKRLSIVDDGLLIESESNTIIRKWESITSVQSNEAFVYLILADKRIACFPKKAFPSDAESLNFLGLIQNKVFKIKWDPNFPQNFRIKKPSYYIGLLCLIPFIGAITGVVLIVLGITKYKDRWFAVIGAGGVILTTVLWSLNFYTDTFGFKTVLSQISQKQLNNLMAQVEFYKMKNGVYPDSLQQLDKDNTLIIMYDPLRPGGKATKADEYYYQKVGGHYYLFSSGIDGIPGTKDDIYPQVVKADSAKFGLIHK